MENRFFRALLLETHQVISEVETIWKPESSIGLRKLLGRADQGIVFILADPALGLFIPKALIPQLLDYDIGVWMCAHEIASVQDLLCGIL